MSRRTATPGAGALSQSSATTTKQTKALLACGVVAGPLFLVVGLIQAFTVLVITAWPDLDTVSVQLVLASAIQFAFLAALAAGLLRGLPDTADARLAKITRPTLVATGAASPDSFVAGGGDFFDQAADAIAASIPHAQHQTIAGQSHMVDPKALAPVLERFFGA